MWPFTKREKPDSRPVTDAVIGIVASLRREPHRWKITSYDTLTHDSGVVIDTERLFVCSPWIGDDEPEANAVYLEAAINEWVHKRLNLPIPSLPEKTDAGTNNPTSH